jgi:hypothetical protein
MRIRQLQFVVNWNVFCVIIIIISSFEGAERMSKKLYKFSKMSVKKIKHCEASGWRTEK